MTGWLLPLVGLVVLPAAGAALDAATGARREGLRRILSAAAHLSAAACAVLVAAAAGRRPPDLRWDLASTALVLLAGAGWIEAVFLSGVRLRSRQKATSRSVRALPTQSDRSRAGRTGSPGSPLPLSAEGEALLARVVALDSLPVTSIMTPRDRMVAVDGAVAPEEALERMRSCGRVRLPVTVDGSLDRIVGVVHAKDLVPFVVGGGTASSLRRHLHRCLWVPPDRPVGQLLVDFRRSRVHFGMVIDALGRTLGLVTIGDVFAYLAGTRRGRPENCRTGGGPASGSPDTGEEADQSGRSADGAPGK